MSFFINTGAFLWKLKLEFYIKNPALLRGISLMIGILHLGYSCPAA